MLRRKPRTGEPEDRPEVQGGGAQSPGGFQKRAQRAGLHLTYFCDLRSRPGSWGQVGRGVVRGGTRDREKGRGACLEVLRG